MSVTHYPEATALLGSFRIPQDPSGTVPFLSLTGYVRKHTRIAGALKNLGIIISRTTVKSILKAHGIEAAPQRGKGMNWSTFIKIHLGEIVAADFFTVKILKPFSLVRYYVFFVINIQTRLVQIAGIVHQAYGEWMKQVARNLTDAVDGFLLGKRYFVHDRDPLFTDAFRKILRDSGIRPLRLPARSPNLNSFAERFVLSMRSEKETKQEAQLKLPPRSGRFCKLRQQVWDPVTAYQS